MDNLLEGIYHLGIERLEHLLSPSKVAALFVQPDGCYANLPGVDLWPESRDARLYQGPHPVIAHPPCQLWGALNRVNFFRWGGDHNKPGNDAGCFESALASVRRWGGILEHPAKTFAWESFNLTKPAKNCWIKSDDGWVCEVWQSAYGHKANKATWLFYFGAMKPFQLNWGRPVGKFQVGSPTYKGKEFNKPTLSKREANATPVLFRNELIRLAQFSRVSI